MVAAFWHHKLIDKTGETTCMHRAAHHTAPGKILYSTDEKKKAEFVPDLRWGIKATAEPCRRA